MNSAALKARIHFVARAEIQDDNCARSPKQPLENKETVGPSILNAALIFQDPQIIGYRMFLLDLRRSIAGPTECLISHLIFLPKPSSVNAVSIAPANLPKERLRSEEMIA